MSAPPGVGTPIVYHMAPRARWAAQPSHQPYAGDTLATEGFIHCTAEPTRLLHVANSFYREETGAWVILLVDTSQVTAPVRWEQADGHLFPHVYGPIELAAVVQVLDFPRTAAGAYQLPQALTQSSDRIAS